MLKKSVLCSVLAIAVVNPLIALSASQTDATAPTTSTQSNTMATPTTSATQGDITTTTPTTHGANTQGGVNDTAITDQIKVLYQKSPLVKEQNVSITTINHQVILKGRVDTDMEYERAISLAQSVQGVDEVNVDNLLVKDSSSPLADTLTTAKVKGTLMKEKLFGNKDIEYWPVSVETKNGVVYLAGAVDTNEQRINIENLVKKVNGVKSVKSSLTIQKNANKGNNVTGENNQNNYEDNDTNTTE